MATRVFGPTGSKRRRRFLVAPILVAALVAFGVLATGGSVRTVAPPAVFRMKQDWPTHVIERSGSWAKTAKPASRNRKAQRMAKPLRQCTVSPRPEDVRFATVNS